MSGMIASRYPLPAQAVLSPLSDRQHHLPTPHELPQPHDEMYNQYKANDYQAEPHNDELNDMTDMTFFEAVYLLLLSGAGVGLGYLASSLDWPTNFAPLIGFGILLYLIVTHRSCLSPPPPYHTRLPLCPADEESLSFSPESVVSSKVLAGATGRVDIELRAIMGLKRPGTVAGVYVFGGGRVGAAPGADAGSHVWVIVEDMDA